MTVRCTSVGKTVRALPLTDSVSDDYRFQTGGHHCSSYVVLDHTDSPLSFAEQHTTLLSEVTCVTSHRQSHAHKCTCVLSKKKFKGPVVC